MSAHLFTLCIVYHFSFLKKNACSFTNPPRRRMVLLFGPSVQSSHSVASNSLWSHESQHARPPCPSPMPGVYSNSCLLSWWCHPTISSSFVPFSSRLQSFPASRSFPMSQFFTSVGQVSEFQLQHQSFQWIFRMLNHVNNILQCLEHNKYSSGFCYYYFLFWFSW